MKLTIKQWCGKHGFDWFGQGVTGSTRYDWKLVLGKGRTAIFASAVVGPMPIAQRVGKRDVLIFPNVNLSSKGGKISEPAFLRIIAWVEDCIDGKVREMKASNPATATSEPAPGADSSLHQGRRWV